MGLIGMNSIFFTECPPLTAFVSSFIARGAASCLFSIFGEKEHSVPDVLLFLPSFVTGSLRDTQPVL